MTTRNRAWASVGGVALVLTVCVIYLLAAVLRLPVGHTSPVISVSMPETGGLFVGSTASYRGVVVGKVVDMDLDEQGVEATVRLEAGTQVPVDSVVRVRSLSPVGEQYLDFEPRTFAGPYLADGDRIAASAMSVPETVAGLARSLDRVMSQVDTDQLRTVLDELGTGLAGADDDVQRLLADSSRLITTLDDHADVLTRLVGDGHVVLTLGVQTSDELRSATSSYAVFSAWLHAHLPLLDGLLEGTPQRLEQLRRLIGGLNDVLPGYLRAQSDLDGLVSRHDPQLRALLSDYPPAVDAFARTFRDGRIQFDLLMRRGELCHYVTEPRGAHDATFRELQDQGHCSTGETEIAQRGAQFAPGSVREAGQ